MSKKFLVSVVVVVLLFAAFGLSHLRANQEVQRLSRAVSPDGKLEVIVSSVDADATVSTPFELFLVAAGNAPSQDDLIFKSDKSEAPLVKWLDARTVEIDCGRARIWHYQNFGSIKLADGKFAAAKIVLRCGDGS
jgi:hypothetical protein